MSTKSIGGRRRKPEFVRREALEAGRRLLHEGGPRAVTLKGIGAELGMTHANLIHHFGSAEAFQAQLKDVMVEDLTREITAIVADPSQQSRDPSSIVAKTFDAYGRGGIAILIAWSIMTGASYDEARLTAATRELVASIAPRLGGADHRAREIVALVTSLAFADGLIGAALADAVGCERLALRDLTVRLVERLNEEPVEPADQAR